MILLNKFITSDLERLSGIVSLLSSGPGGPLSSLAHPNKLEDKVMRITKPRFKEIGASRTQLLQGAVQRAKAFSIPKRIYVPIIKKIDNWRRCSGEGWTVDRLKAIKLDVIRHRAGMPPVSTWIARNSSYFKGEFGALEKWMSLNDSRFSRGIQLLQIYTLFYAKGITPKQEEKFVTAVVSEPPLPSIISFSNDVIDRGYDLLPVKVKYLDVGKCQPLVDMLPSPNKRSPLPKSSVPEEEGIVDSLKFLFETQEGFSHYIKYKHSHYYDLLGGLWDVLIDPENRVNNKGIFDPLQKHGSFLVGRIGLIQEAGYKLRAVANPGRVFQRVLEPFGKRIYSYLSSLPFDCTFDQTKAIPVLQEALSHGKTIHSIDLSDATSYFPLALQDHLLRKMFPDIEVNLFSDLSQASWFMPHRGEISWRRGQPLGLYPSFGAFALTHGTLLLGLLNKEWNNQFFVLGDDVVILDDQLAQDYYQCLSLLGCPVSVPKSLHSNSICEFGGKIITSSTVISQYKWRDISDDSFIDIAKILGPKSLALFKPRQVKILKRLAPIPDFLGGLGWNPEGLPLESRCLDRLIWQEQLPVDLLMDYSVVRLRNLLKSKLYSQTIFHRPIGHQATWIDKDRDLDQRSSLLIRKLLPSSLWKMDKKLLSKNIDGVSLSLYGKHADLPINSLQGNTLRPSLLQMMEAKVRQ